MTWPAWAKAPSISPATDESRPEKTSFGARPGVASSTFRRATESPSGLGSRHAAASRYAFPADRSLAPSQVTLNQGCFARSAMNCWPTMPVAPRTPTSIGAMTAFLTPFQAGLKACATPTRDQKKSRRCGVGGTRLADLRFDLTLEHNSPDATGPLSRARLARLLHVR